MSDLDQFINGVENVARRVLKNHNKKQTENALKERIQLLKEKQGKSKHKYETSSPSKLNPITKDQLKQYYKAGNASDSPSKKSNNKERPNTKTESINSKGELPKIHSSPVLSPDSISLTDGRIAKSNNIQLPPVYSKSERFATKRKVAMVQKLMKSPLSKAVSKPTTNKSLIEQVDGVEAMLELIGLREKKIVNIQKPGHSVETRMCLACWSNPQRRTGCNHHRQILPRHQKLPNFHPQSWSLRDLYNLYRCEVNREIQYHQTIEQIQQTEDPEEQAKLKAFNERHPVYDKAHNQIDLANLSTKKSTRLLNEKKTYIFDVNHFWLTNLDHFNHSKNYDDENGLKDRKDIASISRGYSQIQSISERRSKAHVEPLNDAYQQFRHARAPKSRDGNHTDRSRVTIENKQIDITDFQLLPLSLLVCGQWDEDACPNLLNKVLGAQLQNKAPLLRCIVDSNEKYFELDGIRNMDLTRALALFERDPKTSSSNTVLVKLVMALDATIRAPVLLAWIHEYSTPHPPDRSIHHPRNQGYIDVLFQPSYIPEVMHSLTVELQKAKLLSNLDGRYPPTTLTHNPYFYYDKDTLCIKLQHQDELLRSRGFRDSLIAVNAVEPDFDVSARMCAVQLAQPNTVGKCGRSTWHSIEEEDRELTRRRIAKDFIDIISNPNGIFYSRPDCSFFVILLTHEMMRDVHVHKLSKHLDRLVQEREKEEIKRQMEAIEVRLEQGRLLIAAKKEEAERQQAREKAWLQKQINHIEDDEKVILEENKEWEDRLAASDATGACGKWEQRMIRESQVAFYFAIESNAVHVRDRCTFDKPEGFRLTDSERKTYPLSSRTDPTPTVDVEKASDQEGLIENLLANEEFLEKLKEKLGLCQQAIASTYDYDFPSNMEDNTEAAEDSLSNEEEDSELMRMIKEEGDNRENMQLKIRSLHKKKRALNGERKLSYGQGWRRYRCPRLTPNFHENVYGTHVVAADEKRERNAWINCTNRPSPVGIRKPWECSAYTINELDPELKTMFTSQIRNDLYEKMRRLDVQSKKVGNSHEEDVTEAQNSELNKVAKALLCAKTNNISGLETLLDDGVDMNVRDDHGNSLFILACQQGDKRIAKLLMRRRVDMNAQNIHGNTALHYLIEYNHRDMANYLIEKGADDTIPNAAGKTCYEGLSGDDDE